MFSFLNLSYHILDQLSSLLLEACGSGSLHTSVRIKRPGTNRALISEYAIGIPEMRLIFLTDPRSNVGFTAVNLPHMDQGSVLVADQRLND